MCSDRPRTDAEMEAKLANTTSTCQVGSSGAVVGSSVGPQGGPSDDHDQDGFQMPKRRKRKTKKALPIVIPKPKLQYVPKKNLNDKGKASVPPQGTSHYTDSSPVRFHTEVASKHPMPNQSSNPQVETSSSVPIDQNVKLSNQFEGLGRLSVDDSDDDEVLDDPGDTAQFMVQDSYG